MRTVGVEEEFMLVSPDGTLRAVAPAVLAYARRDEPVGSDGPGGHLEKELKQEQIETSTHPCRRLDDLAAELRRGRAAADASARRAGARVAAVATAPDATASEVFAEPRALRMGREFGALVDEQLTCGCHVHVEVADDDEGVRVIDHLRPWNAVLLALSANSPFWRGADTGYASFRTEVWYRWPTAGPTAPFGDAATYHRVVEDLLASGTILDSGMVYFDARLSTHYPTVEVRVADVCLDVEDAVLQAALVRALAETAAESGRDAGGRTAETAVGGGRVAETAVAGGRADVAVAAGRVAEAAVAGSRTPGPAAQPRTELLRVASWRAARTGLTGDLVHPATGRPAPAAVVVRALLEHVSPALDAAGDLDRVTDRLDHLLAHGTGAQVQRRWRADGADDAQLLARAVERTQA